MFLPIQPRPAAGPGPAPEPARRRRSSGCGCRTRLANRRCESREALCQHPVIVLRPGVPRDLGDIRAGGMEIIGERDDRGRCFRHDPLRLLPLGGLAMQVGHCTRVARREPTIKLGRVRVALERRDPGGIEAQCLRESLDLAAARLGSHTRIVSRRHRANRTTSSSGGTASSSPYAVNIRHRRYSRGGRGRKGARWYQSRARNSTPGARGRAPAAGLRGRAAPTAERETASPCEPAWRLNLQCPRRPAPRACRPCIFDPL